MSSQTIFQALTWASDKLKAAQQDLRTKQNPKLDAQVLMAHCLQKPTSYLFAHGDEPLKVDIENKFQQLVARRALHEPIAYLTGEKDFHGRTFKVTPATLVPRPETELMVDVAKTEIGNDALVVDVGTGSGAIAITLAADGVAEVLAIDISQAALDVAQENAVTHNVQDTVAFLEGNLLKPFFALFEKWKPEARPKSIVITANLPYLSEVQWEMLDPDVKKYEPKTALVGGLDGLAFYDELLMQLAARRRELPEHVVVLFEIDPGQASSAQALIRHYFPGTQTTVIPDLAGLTRIIRAAV